ncbi:MAG: hypothetical protein JKY65_18530 [Planctomycetes bacterium]|nr:hypothetical protein [Planctomycetota bacterium]
MGHDYDDDYDDGYGDHGEGYDDHPQQSGGAGKIVLIVVIVVAVVGCLCMVPLVAAIAIPNLLEARQNGNEAAAIGGLKAISNAQTLYREGDADGDSTLNYAPALADLGQVGYIDSVLAGGVKQGYEFQASIGANPEFEWWASAFPAVPGTTGSRYFYTNHSGQIWYSTTEFSLPVDLNAPPPGFLPLGR